MSLDLKQARTVLRVCQAAIKRTTSMGLEIEDRLSRGERPFQQLRSHKPRQGSVAEFCLTPAAFMGLDACEGPGREPQISSSDQEVCKTLPSWIVSYQHQGVYTVFLLLDEMEE